MTASAVYDWLEASGLAQYADALVGAGYDDLEVLSSLDDADLDAVGITAPGHRKKLLLHSRRLASGDTGPSSANLTNPTNPAANPSGNASTGRRRNLAQGATTVAETGERRLGLTTVKPAGARLGPGSTYVLGTRSGPPPMRHDVTGNALAQTTRGKAVNLDEVNDDPDEVTLLVERLAVESHNRRVRVKDFFSPYDALKSGYVSVPQFRRGIAATGLDVTEAEIDLLVAAFSVRKTNFGGDQFDYVAFSQPFGERDLEKEPRRTARNPRSQLLHIDVVRGIAPPPRFIGTHDPDAPPVETVPGNTTQRWAGAKDPGAKKPKPSRNPHTKEHPTLASASAPVDKLSPDEKQLFVTIMGRLRAVVKQRGIVVKILFRDFDRSRNGFVTRSQFRQSLPPFFGLTEDEAQLVMRKYTKGKFSEVDYMSFHEALESDEIPLHAPDIASALEPVTIGSRDISKCELTEDMRDVASRDDATEAILDRLNADIFAGGIRIRDHLKVHDKFVTGHVLPAKFQAGFVSAGLQVTELEFLLVCHWYRRPTDGKINYHTFCRRMEKYDSGISPEGVPMITAAGKTSTLAKLPVPDVPAGTDPDTGTLHLRKSKSGINIAKLLLKIQNQVAKNRIRVLEFFRDYDKLRKGWVTRAKFRSALTQMNIQLEAIELKDLEERFILLGTENSTRDISYVEFCEWIDTAFTRPNLERTPNAPPPEWSLNEHDPIYMTEEEAEQLEDLMDRLAKEVQVRGVVPKPVFADFDKTKIGTISRNQFLQGLTFLSLRVSDRETDLLCKRFREKHADGREDVRYGEFARVLLELGENF